MCALLRSFYIIGNIFNRFYCSIAQSYNNNLKTKMKPPNIDTSLKINFMTAYPL